MIWKDLLDRHRVPIGGTDGIDYIFSLDSKSAPADIDVTSRCETASAIIKAGEEAGLLRLYPLLIIGGGPAGATAALTALSLDINGVQIADDAPFFKAQRSCKHRFLHPRIYKWPNAGCHTPHYVPVGPGLKWTADYAHRVVTQWDEQTPAFTEDSRYKPLPKIPDGTVESSEDIRTLIKTGPDEQEWGMVLVCIAPKEVTKIGSFSGHRFWEPDRLDEEKCGCASEEPQILICGSGDGALQDFLRINCPGKNIQDLYDCLESMVNQIGFTLRAELNKIAALPHDAHDDVHDKCVTVIDDLLATEKGRAAVQSFVENACSKSPINRSISLAFLEPKFKKCYLLNRFLTLLIGRFKENVNGIKIFHSQMELKEVCENDSRYLVKFDREDSDLHNKSFDRVILRLGVKRAKLSENGGFLSL